MRILKHKMIYIITILYCVLMSNMLSNLANAEESCCGDITSDGVKYALFLNGLHVDTLWLNGKHINWFTGESDMPNATKNIKSHCSSFVASVAKRLNISLLNPDQRKEGQQLLANAQDKWFEEKGTPQFGWVKLDSAENAQTLANEGQLVVAVVSGANAHKAGHIAIIRPSTKSMNDLLRDGPEIIQAGEENYIETNLATGFKHHPGAWDNNGNGKVRFYYHTINGDYPHQIYPHS